MRLQKDWIDGRIAVDVGFAVVKSTEINANNTEITVEFEWEISDAVKNTIKTEIVRDDQTPQHKLEESGTLVQAGKMTMIPGSSGKWKGLKVRIDPRDYHNDEQMVLKCTLRYLVWQWNLPLVYRLINFQERPL